MSNTKESKEEKIKELTDEFWSRIYAIPPSDKKNVLDGGYSPQNEVLKWFKEESKKLEAEYSE